VQKQESISTEEKWDIVVKPKSSWFSLNIAELFAYKDLILLMMRRDITSVYKQTILGPLWMLIQPIFTTAIYTFTFSVSAGISTDNMPAILFYLMGQTFWNYFADVLNKTSATFIANASVFGKVYFPRLVMPISVMLSNLIKLALQILLLAAVYIYYYLTTDQLEIQWFAFIMVPICVVLLGCFSFSLGIIFSSFTTKYRDFSFLLGFTVQLLMFASCVVFPVSMYSESQQEILMYNPIVACMESVKYSLTGHGYFSVYHLGVSALIISVFLVIGAVIFNRTEKSFMDTV
jgi:lipopolysaccharide transport system permease protein